MTEAFVAIIRFFRGSLLLGTTPLVKGQTLLQSAEDAGVEIPSNCTSGTCGSCMVTLKSGKIPLPEELPPGLDDEYLLEQDARLACIGLPTTSVDIELSPPL